MLRHLLTLAFVWPLLAHDAPLVQKVDSIGINVSDLDRSLDFYTKILHFEKVSEYEAAGDAYEHLQGLFGLRQRTARLRLGAEFLELTEYLVPRGAPVPADSRSNDLWFQHVALIVRDVDVAYRWLRSHQVRYASSGPQRLPDWNPHAGGIQAFYFQDPDGHTLEILSFPPDKGSKWHALAARTEALFLGIDHTAIVISDTETSLRFYRDLLGCQVAGESENYGPEQEHLNNVFGARLRITGVRAAEGPGIEFLEYLAPRDGRPFPPGTKANDLVHWQTRFSGSRAAEAAQAFRQARSPLVSTGLIEMPGPEAGFRRALIVRDPDGHAIQYVE